ncbi:hypothetical protein XENORESO_002807, partial [Xenotaenia resolanae]
SHVERTLTTLPSAPPWLLGNTFGVSSGIAPPTGLVLSIKESWDPDFLFHSPMT